jgi:hypothetical protein
MDVPSSKQVAFENIFLCALYVTLDGTVSLYYDTLIWELANTVAHPLRMADVFRKQGWKVALMDIGGIHRNGMDLPNIIACERGHGRALYQRTR